MLHVKHGMMANSVIINNESLFSFKHLVMGHFVDFPYLMEDLISVASRKASEQERVRVAYPKYDSQKYAHLSL